MAFVEDKGATLLEAYASIYDEIVRGYTNGTRDIYVEDNDAESGYRKMTMQEEINGLDKAKVFFNKMSEEDIPENISDCMLEAKQNFLDLYLQHDGRGLNLRNLLGNIKIFS